MRTCTLQAEETVQQQQQQLSGLLLQAGEHAKERAIWQVFLCHHVCVFVCVCELCVCVCVCVCVCECAFAEFLHGFAIKFVLCTTRRSRGTRGLQNGMNFHTDAYTGPACSEGQGNRAPFL